MQFIKFLVLKNVQPKPIHLGSMSDLSRMFHIFNEFSKLSSYLILFFFLYHSFINPHELLSLEQYQSASSKFVIEDCIYELTGNKVLWFHEILRVASLPSIFFPGSSYTTDFVG